jgi:methanogenic corrinoid protein MtbC1
MMKLLVVANHGIDSAEVCDAIVKRAVAGPVHVTLVAPASVGGNALSVPYTTYGQRAAEARQRATAERMERAMRQLRDAGVVVEGLVSGDADAVGIVQDAWNPSRFDEIVVSCRPWLSCTRDVPQSDLA